MTVIISHKQIHVNKLKSQSSVRSECPTNYTYILLTIIIKKTLYFYLLYIIHLNLDLLSIFLHLINQKYLHKVQDEGKVHGSCHMKPHDNHAITQHTFYTCKIDRGKLQRFEAPDSREDQVQCKVGLS